MFPHASFIIDGNRTKALFAHMSGIARRSPRFMPLAYYNCVNAVAESAVTLARTVYRYVRTNPATI